MLRDELTPEQLKPMSSLIEGTVSAVNLAMIIATISEPGAQHLAGRPGVAEAVIELSEPSGAEAMLSVVEMISEIAGVESSARVDDGAIKIKSTPYGADLIFHTIEAMAGKTDWLK